jgi:GAF domain-containing protein
MLIKKLHLLQKDASSILEFRTKEEDELANKLNQEHKNTEEIAISIDSITNDQNLSKDQIKDLYSSLQSNIINTASMSSDLYENFKNQANQIGEMADPFYSESLTPEQIKKRKMQIVDKALEIVCNNINCQSAAVFLISKSGFLERFGIRGWSDNSEIKNNNNWFPLEKYEIGKSFTGLAAKAEPGERYGKIKSTDNLSEEDLDPLCREEYKQKFKELRCAIAVPLNGRNRTYGVLRIINKVEEQNDNGKKIRLISRDSFSEEDVRVLLFLSTYLANTLSNFRRDIESDILKYLSRLLIRYSNQYPVGINNDVKLKSVCQNITDLLVKSPETAFQACILRRANKNGSFEYQSSSLAPGITKRDNNDARVIGENRSVWFVVGKGKRLIIKDLQKSRLLSQFNNKKWIDNNKFVSFGCFPLVEKDEVVGTLSVYIGFEYSFHPDGVAFLQGIADLLALFFMKIKQEEMQLELSSLQEERKQSLSRVRRKFEVLAKQWRRDTATFPILFDRLTHPSYQKIIGLGNEVVPILIEELNNRPDHWFWALEAIVGESPVPPAHHGIIKEMIEAWTRWGNEQGYV